ncbi:mitotic-spindle organizing protein 1-like isoform X1 [Branchiostoma floridae x Branchiostoma belcheri]
MFPPGVRPTNQRAAFFEKTALQEISRLLNTGLDSETLSICVRLIEQGVNPEALASVIKELRRETAALKAAERIGSPSPD